MRHERLKVSETKFRDFATHPERTVDRTRPPNDPVLAQSRATLRTRAVREADRTIRLQPVKNPTNPSTNRRPSSSRRNPSAHPLHPNQALSETTSLILSQVPNLRGLREATLRLIIGT